MAYYYFSKADILRSQAIFTSSNPSNVIPIRRENSRSKSMIQYKAIIVFYTNKFSLSDANTDF